MLFFFFFSSRRRHTRLQGDWSSDVCSSDLSPLSASNTAPPYRNGTTPLHRICEVNFELSLRRTDAVGICRDLLAIDARIRLLSDFRAFRYAWTCRGDCGGWNRSGEKGKCVSGSRRCIGLEPRCCHGRPNVNRHPGHVLAFAVRGTTRLNSSHLVISYAVFCLK